jgi:4-hydroxy-tetrahydrodipicolinate synthase
LIEHILSGGVNGLFVLGTTGEAPALSSPLRRQVVELTCQHTRGRVPVLVGITDTSFTESARLAQVAKDAGAQAVVASAPYYFAASQSELLEYFCHLAAEVSLPLFLYNAPSNTHHVLEPDTVRRAAEHPNIIGLKDSSANMIYFHSVRTVLNQRPDFTMLVGPEELMAEAVILGGHGAMCGGANFFPKLYVALYKAALNRNMDEITALQSRVMQIRTKLYHVGPYASSYLKGLKCAVSLLGICDDFVAEPFRAFDANEREIVRTHMINLGLLEPSVTMSSGGDIG